MIGHSLNYNLCKTSCVTSFNTKFEINQEHFTQRTRELAIDSEPELILPFLANA